MNIKSLLISSAAALAAVSGAMADDIFYGSSAKCVASPPDLVVSNEVGIITGDEIGFIEPVTASTEPKYGIDIGATKRANDPGPKIGPQLAEAGGRHGKPVLLRGGTTVV